jgi:hypothetical protein
MNVWRGITLTLWTVVLTILAAFVMQYHAFQSTALDAQQVKTELKNGGAYERLRDTYLRDTARTLLEAKYPDNKLIDDALITSVLQETLPNQELGVRLDPVVDATYRWLDSKEPEILFAIDLSDREEMFYRSLEVQLGKKIAELPSCGDYRYPPEEAVLIDRCIPVYTSDDEVTTAIVEGVKIEGSPLSDPITPETITLPQTYRATLKQIPTYLNYLWVLNVIALILLGLIAVFLIASRRLLGLVALGISLILAGATVLLTTPMIAAIKAPATDGVSGLLQSLIDAFIPSYVASSTQYGLIALGAGALIVTLTALWKWRGRIFHAK